MARFASADLVHAEALKDPHGAGVGVKCLRPDLFRVQQLERVVEAHPRRREPEPLPPAVPGADDEAELTKAGLDTREVDVADEVVPAEDSQTQQVGRRPLDGSLPEVQVLVPV